MSLEVTLKVHACIQQTAALLLGCHTGTSPVRGARVFLQDCCPVTGLRAAYIRGPGKRLLLSSSGLCMQARATPLAPGEWRAMLRDVLPLAGGPAGAGEGAAGWPRPVVLDVRNAYEWDAGHFAGAKRPLEVLHSF